MNIRKGDIVQLTLDPQVQGTVIGFVFHSGITQRKYRNLGWRYRISNPMHYVKFRYRGITEECSAQVLRVVRRGQ